jgi:peptidoglycan hydrolase-like protein with peptidoglycan-binding domain
MISRNLQWGDTGADVKELQNILLTLGYDIGGAADGNFGPNTTAAVSALQDQFGLPMTGVADTSTVAEMYGLLQQFGYTVTSTGAIVKTAGLTTKTPAIVSAVQAPMGRGTATPASGINWTLIGIASAVILALIFFQDER